MKTLTSSIVLAMLISAAAVAQQGQGSSHMEGMHGGMMMDHQHMMEMNKNFEHMQHMMSTIQSEKDPKKCEELLQQHMQAMQQGMQMMGGTMGMGSMMNHGNDKDMPAMTQEQRLQMMENRMQMMQMMMGQMMQHNAVEEKMENNKSDK